MAAAIEEGHTASMRASPVRVVWPLLLVGCATSVHHDWTTYAYAGAEPHSETHELVVECGGAATTVYARLKCDTEAGDLDLRLVDPSGVERHVESVRGNRTATLRWPAQAGIWRLQMTAKDVVGSWSAEFAATNLPIEISVGVSIDRASK